MTRFRYQAHVARVLHQPAGAQDDVLFRAMQDEMDRSMTDLRIEGMDPPYFLSYRLQDNDVVQVEARYGALVRSDVSKNRYLYVDCRVGDPSFDNSNFVASWQDLNRQRQGVVEDDDYEWVEQSVVHAKKRAEMLRKARQQGLR